MANYTNTDLFETTYTDPSGQDWKMVLRSLIPQYTGQPLGDGASPLSASTGYVVRWTWSNLNDPETGGNYPGTTHIQVDDATNAPFTSYANAEAYTLTTDFTTNDLIDQDTVEIVSAADASVPQNWYYYNLDMAYPGLSMRWESDVDNPNKAVLGSSASISVYVDDAQESILTNAIVGAELNLCLSVYKADDDGDFVSWWHGIALPEALSFEVREGRRLLDMDFSCGLALLNDIDWKDSSGNPFTGQLSLLATTMQSLRRMPHFGNFTFKRPEVSLQVAGNTTVSPEYVIGTKLMVPGYTGTLFRVTNDVTLATYVDVDASTDLLQYDGYKVMAVFDQNTGTIAYSNSTYANCPSFNYSQYGFEFDGTSQYLVSTDTGFFEGDLTKCIIVSIDPDVDSPTGVVFAQGDAASAGAGEVYRLEVENDQFAHRFDTAYETYSVSMDATLDNQVLISKTTVSGGDMADWTLTSNNSELTATTVGSPTTLTDTVAAVSYLGVRVVGGSFSNYLDGIIHGAVVFNGTLPSLLEEKSISDDMIDLYQNGVTPAPEVKGGWAFSTYGTPLPVDETYDEWDPSVHDSFGHMFCQAETFNEPKETYDRKFEMRPDPSFISTGHVLEDICKTLGMSITQWEGGWHLFSTPYLHKTTNLYLAFPDAANAPYAWRYTWNITDGAQENTYEQVSTSQEYEDFAAPRAGLVKTFSLPYKGVKLSHEKTPSDVIYGSWHNFLNAAAPLTYSNKLAPDHPGNDLPASPSDTERYGDARLGYKGRLEPDRKRRKGTMWTMIGAYYADGHSFDANGGGQGADLSPRAQHKRLEDGVTGGGPNLSFYDGRYLGPDSLDIQDIDLEAGETLRLEMGGYVDNGRLDDHIGQTYVFRHRVEIRQDDGTKYRLRRHVITQDTWTDNGTERKTVIDGDNFDVDKNWPGDKDYYIKEYDSLAWVREVDVTANEWEDCWYEVMTFHPETTRTEGEGLAPANLTALPYYGNAPLGTVYNSDTGVLDVDKENRVAYVNADLAVELPGTAGVDEFTSLYTEVGISCWNPSQGPRAVHGFAGSTPRFVSRKADGSHQKTPSGIAITPTNPGSTTDMPYVMGWNKWVIRYGEQGESNTLDSYADGGAGVRIYDAGSSRLASRFVFNTPEYKGRIKVEHMDGTGFGPMTFHTQWRPHQYSTATSLFNDSLHEQVTYETLDLVGYVRPRYEGSWVKHPGTTQGGCPAPFLPHVARCLDPDAAVAIIPYRMRWIFAEGFQMEGVEVGDAYEKTRISLVTGDTSTGGTGGGTSALLTRLGAIGAQANQSAQRPQFMAIGSGNTSVGGTTAPYGTFNYSTATDDGTGIYYEELWGTNTPYVSNVGGFSNRFDVVDGSNFTFYQTANLGRMIVQEPGLYMIELQGTLDNAATSGTANTYGFAMHRLGTVSNNTFTGGTTITTANILENIAFKSGNTGSGDYLDGTWSKQVRLDRGDLITFSAYNSVGATNMAIFNGADKLKIRLVKLTEQEG